MARIFNFCIRAASHYKREQLHKAKNASENKYLKDNTYPEITNAELREIQQAWPYMHLTKADLTWSRIYKKEHGFSPDMMGVWQTHLLRQALNPSAELSAFEHKAMCDVYFPNLPYPKAFVRRIHGVYYDTKMNVLTPQEAVRILQERGSYIIKPAFGTMQGQDVHKVTLQGSADEKRKMVELSFAGQSADFIAQEVLIQHPDVAALNPTSLNCCRVTTIYLDGHFDYSTIIKFGRKGSDVDNWHSSFFGGVSSTGVLLPKAYDYKLASATKTDLGLAFGGRQLPAFDQMIAMVEQAHKRYFPNCGFIGWDVFIDADNAPRLIEANLTIPGIVGEQYASGTFFGKFRSEVNNRMKQQER